MSLISKNYIKINKSRLNEVVAMYQGLYKPCNEFLDKRDQLTVINSLHFKKKFFPFPILFDVSKKQYSFLKGKKEIDLYFKSTKICSIKIKSLFSLEIKNFIKKIFGTINQNHYGVQNFLKKNRYFLSGKIFNFKKNNKIYKSYDISRLLKEIKKNKKKKIVAFHTRNIPHKGHEWILLKLLKNFDKVIIQPITGNLKSGDFKSKVVEKVYKNFISNVSIKDQKKFFFHSLKLNAYYGGPREALLHGLIRKNLNCTHIFIGRDHAGVGNFYKKNESINFFKKNQKKLKIKIVSFPSPRICKKCKKINNMANCYCNNKKKKTSDIKASIIRTRLKKNLKLPNYYISEEVGKLLNSQSLRK